MSAWLDSTRLEGRKKEGRRTSVAVRASLTTPVVPGGCQPHPEPAAVAYRIGMAPQPEREKYGSRLMTSPADVVAPRPRVHG